MTILLLVAMTIAAAAQNEPATVTIGTQTWMAKNLNVGNRINLNQPSTDNGIAEKYCYGNIEANCAKYGAFYAWDELMSYGNPKDLCPDGFRVPTEADFILLLSVVGENSAIKLKALTTWGTTPYPGTDEFGYGWVGSGYGYAGNQWACAGMFGYSWTSTLPGAWPVVYSINNYGLVNGQSNVGKMYVYKDGKYKSYLPVRCIKEE